MRQRLPGTRALRQRGALLIEVLVAIILCAFALLGFAALQARAGSAEFEAVQRGQALMMVEDMASRINNNRTDARNYPMAGLIGTGGVEMNGPYMAAGKHNYIMRVYAEAIARQLGDALVAPIVPFVPEGNIALVTSAV